LSSPRLADLESASVRLIDPAQHEYVHFSGGIWLRALVHMYLDRADRRRWYALPASSPDRMALLMGRIAAVEAVKASAWSHHGTAVDPGDVEVEDDGTGQIRCMIHLRNGDDLARSVSLARAGDCVVAAAAAEAGARVGAALTIDGAEEQAELAALLSADETALLERLDVSGPAALWCACEAVGKAVGRSPGWSEGIWRLVGSASDRLELAVGDAVLRVVVHQEDARVLAVCVVAERTAHAVRERLVSGVGTDRN
jgi:hypothetical protein